jgi:hypothetical protein
LYAILKIEMANYRRNMETQHGEISVDERAYLLIVHIKSNAHTGRDLLATTTHRRV